MADILTFTRGPTDATAVRAVTTALARALHLTAGQHALPAGDDEATAELLLAVADPGVRVAVLGCRSGLVDRLVEQVIGHCSKPVVLVPSGEGAVASDLISRILVPLDGTAPSAETVAETVALFAASGADIVALHVFDATTVPKFWDQAAHARRSWDEEFLARYCNQPDARLELRSGSPGTSILDVAATEHADLIALGWAQDLSPGRAMTVRTTIAQTSTPILLLPIPGADGRPAPRPEKAVRP